MMRMRAKYVQIQYASSTGVADRWREQYCRDGRWNARLAFGNPEDIHTRLCALGPNPDRAKVAKIIGNKSWSYLSCDGCGDYCDTLVGLGEYETKGYCGTCLREAVAVLDSAS